MTGQEPSPPGYLVVGHVTKDVVPGGYRLGGTVSFASRTAHRLGTPAAVLTCGEHLPELDTELDGIAVHRVPAIETTTFENVYTPAGRTQFVRAVAPPLARDAVPDAWRPSPVVHLGPVAQEVPPELADSFPPTTLIGATPQGWMRAWDATGRVHPVPWANADHVLSRIDALIFSGEDMGHDDTLVRRYASAARLAVVTEDRNGCTVWQGGRTRRYPAFQVDEAEPTGAGDVFAAAFLIRFGETRDAATAARFANCAASFAVETPGRLGFPTRERVEERLRTGKTYD